MNTLCGVNWQLVLDFLKALTNWQLLAFVGCMVGGRVFKSQIGKLIDRIATIEMFGGKIETASEQSQAIKENPPTDSALPEVGIKTEAQSVMADLIKDAANQPESGTNESASTTHANSESSPLEESIVLQLTQAQVDKVNAMFDTERATATLWEFRFMNYFFAVSTQAVLNWLSHLNKPVTRDQYNSVWLNMVNKPEERSAIL